MSSIPVIVKHAGKRYDVEVDTDNPGEIFKYQLFSLTGVEPDRQKIIIKGKQLKDDTDMSTLGLKPGAQILMMGTPGPESAPLTRPSMPIKFVEDMTAAEAAQQEGALPAGLQNLGNTCYLNSTLQALRSIPELQAELKTYKAQNTFGGDLGGLAVSLSNTDLVAQLRDLYKDMAATQDGVPPVAFLTSLRMLFPQFAEKSRSGNGFAQQDAEEAWSQIVGQIDHKLKVGEGSSAAQSFIQRYMAVGLATSLECDEPEAKEGGEEPIVGHETEFKIRCHIDMSTNHLRDGIMAGLSESLEKRSEILGRDAKYTKTTRIARLPKYLTVQFVRFFWRRDVQKKAKIMRKVTFPHELDVVEFCTDELKKVLVPVRDKVREVRKEEEDIERARKRRKKNPAGEEASSSATAPSAPAAPAASDKPGSKQPAADGDVDMEYKTDAQVEAEKQASLLTAKKELQALLKRDESAIEEGTNESGLYELRGVVTHQGASADSGHYTAYVKKSAPIDPATGKPGEEDGKWWWFNDDRVSEVPADKIETLAGGGESHSALILLYRAIPLPVPEE